MAPTKRVYHKSISEMRRGSVPMLHPGQCVPMCTPTSCTPSSCAPSSCTPSCLPVCETTNCIPHHPRSRCHSHMSCVHAPYYCAQYRNMSFWCEYCMSRYMFPEHYPVPVCTPPPPPICYAPPPQYHIPPCAPRQTICTPREECTPPQEYCSIQPN